MMKLKNFFFLSALLGIVACQSNEGIEPPPVADGHDTPLSEVRSAEDAIEIANKVMELLANTPEQTRNLGMRKVKSVSCVGNQAATRAEEQDSLLYLINYDDNLGFALISRSRIARPVYAFSDTGNLSMTDTIHNKGLAMFFEDTFNDLELNTASGLNPIVPDPIYIVSQVEPLLDKDVANWDQEYPFNLSTPEINGEHGVVGCGPLAVGRLLTYYSYPAAIGSKKINWGSLMNNDYEEISQYLEALAQPEYLNAKYRDDEPLFRGTPQDNFKPTFEKLGFNTSYTWDFTKFLDEIKSFMNFMKQGYPMGASPLCKAAPVIFYGTCEVEENGEPIPRAHVWVVDGYIDMGSQDTIDPDTKERNPYLHCVWGWGGIANGYFLYSRSKDQGSPIGKDGEDCTYTFRNLEII